ncbi:7-deoxyloganetin glucosyltransferase-like [Aristolochia californica]|uniref:7-deoxyloganetin glucosyltransferase-like n=1 Tax=Aristolochia californica TaxID=171875 RepID=UPI0035D97381
MGKPHAVCVPFPSQGHINPMMQLAKLLHSRGFHITFVNTEFNQRRLLRSGAVGPSTELEDFRFETIPDGLSSPDMDATQNVIDLFVSTLESCLAPFRQLVKRLNADPLGAPPVTCIVSDAGMNFTSVMEEEMGIRVVVLWTMTAASFLCFIHFEELMKRGYVPFKDSCFTDGLLDTAIDWMPGMSNIRLRDFPSFIRTTDPDDVMFNYCMRQIKIILEAPSIIIHSVHELEPLILDAFLEVYKGTWYTIGPFSELCHSLPETKLDSIKSNLWKEDHECLEWLNKQVALSVIYVNYGSIAVLTADQLIEFAWGLANSKCPFLWVVRPDLVTGSIGGLPDEFIEETKGRGLITTWVPQKQVLSHPSVKGFLTHCGWNSVIESIGHGIPMLCWPFFADQMTNCKFVCDIWGIGMEMCHEVKGSEVENLVRELMEGVEGKKLKKKAMEWMEIAVQAAQPGGSSHGHFERLLKNLQGAET